MSCSCKEEPSSILKPARTDIEVAEGLRLDNEGIGQDIDALKEMLKLLCGDGGMYRSKASGELSPAVEAVLDAIERLAIRWVKNTLLLSDHRRGQSILYSALGGE